MKRSVIKMLGEEGEGVEDVKKPGSRIAEGEQPRVKETHSVSVKKIIKQRECTITMNEDKRGSATE